MVNCSWRAAGRRWSASRRSDRTASWPAATSTASRAEPSSSTPDAPSACASNALRKLRRLGDRRLAVIYHITADAKREVRPDDGGFIHCSYPHQVIAVANNVFAGHDSLALLE